MTPLEPVDRAEIAWNNNNNFIIAVVHVACTINIDVVHNYAIFIRNVILFCLYTKIFAKATKIIDGNMSESYVKFHNHLTVIWHSNWIVPSLLVYPVDCWFLLTPSTDLLGGRTFLLVLKKITFLVFNFFS